MATHSPTPFGALFIALCVLWVTPRAAGQTALQPRSDTAAAGQPTVSTLFYIMNATGDAADAGALDSWPSSSLGHFNDSDVIAFRPGFDTSAVKIHAATEFNALVGNPEFDGNFGQIHGGDIDALGLRRPGHQTTRVQTQDLVFSVEHAWGSSYPFLQQEFVGTLDGSLFSLDRASDGTLKIVFFLHEALLTQALGQAPLGPQFDVPMVDIDAFVQDFQGNVYISFRHDELVNGVLLADDGVICLPRSEMVLDSDGNIAWLSPGSALIVLDKPRIDALVSAADLRSSSGNPVGSLTDLQALALDPAGGSFSPVQPVPGLAGGVPNLMFNGQSLGATVLSTRDGGTIATLNGLPLGTSPPDGSALGLDPLSSTGSGADLNGLLVASNDRPQLLVEVDQLTVDHDGELVFVLGNFAPRGWAWIKVASTLPPWGASLAAVPSETGSPYPWLLVPEPSVQWAVPLDSLGRAELTIPLTLAPDVDFWVVFQAYEVWSAELSAPASVWCPWP